MLSILIAVASIGVVSLALTGWLSRPDAPIRILDQPNERSLHERPTPRTGGIAICTALLLGAVVYRLLPATQPLPWQMLSGAMLVAGISILDDRYGLSQMARLLVQLAAAMLLVQSGFVMEGNWLPGWSLPAGSAVGVGVVTALLTLWLTNLYNFMDGMDGFAGGMAVIGFGTLAVFGWGQGDMLFAGSSLAICAAAAGFLVFNFPPARIFMGDSGSTTLGFLVAAFAVWASRRGIAPIWLTLVVFSPFVVDATVTLLKRGLRGEPVWKAHRSHYYQRLVQLGWGHRRTVLAEYAAMLTCAGTAGWMRAADTQVQWGMLMLLAGGYLLAAVAIHRLERIRNVDIQS